MALFKVMKTKWVEVLIIVMALGLLSLCFATFDNTIPADSDAIGTWPTSIRANWDAIEDMLGVGLSVGVSEIINVKSSVFGAEGNGTTDDTTAIQTAVAALVTAGGGTLYFPPGDYLITPSLLGAIAITDLTDFRIVGDGATILCDVTIDDGDNYHTNRMVRLINCSRFSISGLRFLFQMSFDSAVTTVGTRSDTVIDIYYDADFDHTNGYVRDFSIFDNTFEYVGPLLHSPPVNSRIYILLLSTETSTSPARYVRDYSIYNNHFKNCLGRVLHVLLTENGTIFGNTFEELGRLVHPDGDYETWAEAKGIRVHGSSNISVFGNSLDGYSGDLVAEGGKGQVDFLIASQGTATGINENVSFTGNTIKPNKCAGTGMAVGHTYSTSFIGNIILGDEDDANAGFIAVVYATGPSVDSIVANNIIKYIPIVFDTDHSEAYTNNLVDGNLIIFGTNHVSLYANNAESNLLFGRNYYSDTGWAYGDELRSQLFYENVCVSYENETIY